MKIYLFGIGGTGARVVRSMIMLLAAGVKLPKGTSIVPMIVDVDVQNGDTYRTIELMNQYRKIRNNAYSEPVDEGFFHTNIETLGMQQDEDVQKIKDSYQLDFGNIDDTFSNYLKFGDLSKENRDLLESLYDNSSSSNVNTELNLKLTKGFKGNPNIGSVIFNEFSNSVEYKHFERIFTERDRIFIVSSIFGGTGSAGFPQLIKIFRQKSKNAHIKSAKVGGLVVMPYFTVAENKDSAIDSMNFVSKTKAALSYYDKELDGKVEAMYYIGDNEAIASYENNEGGIKQKNYAHLVELISSMSILHYANLDNDDLRYGDTTYFEYGMKNHKDTVNLAHFFSKTQENYLKPLTYFKYFEKLFLTHVPNNLKQDYSKDLELAGISSNKFYKTVKEFFVDCFNPWMNELSKNKPAFNPYKSNEDFNKLIADKIVETSWTNKGITDNAINRVLAKTNIEYNGKINKQEEKFFRVFYDGSVKLFNEYIKDLPS